MSKYAKTAAAALGMLVLGNVDALATSVGGGGTCTGSGCNCNGTGSPFVSENHETGDPSKPILSMAFANDPGFGFSFHIINDAEATAVGPTITVEGGKVVRFRGSPAWSSPYTGVSIPQFGDPFFCKRSDVHPAVYVNVTPGAYTMFLYQPFNTQEVYKGEIVPANPNPSMFCNLKGVGQMIADTMPTCD